MVLKSILSILSISVVIDIFFAIHLTNARSSFSSFQSFSPLQVSDILSNQIKMKIALLLHLLMEGIKATIFEAVQDIKVSDVEIVYSDESPSLLSCAQKCYHSSAVVNFDAPLCQCFVYINGTEGVGTDSVPNNTISGLFYQVCFGFFISV